MRKAILNDIVPKPPVLCGSLISGDNEQIKALRKWERAIAQKVINIRDKIIGKGGKIFRIEGNCRHSDHGGIYYIYADDEEDAYAEWENRVGQECCMAEDPDNVDIDEINIAPFLGIEAAS